MATSALNQLAMELPISRMQRDLRDSTMQRNIGMNCGLWLLSMKSLQKGLGKVTPNREAMNKELEDNPMLLAEAIQTILRETGEVKDPYELLKEFTRGNSSITMGDLQNFIEDLAVSDKTKKRLRKLTLKDYIGLASELAQG